MKSMAIVFVVIGLHVSHCFPFLRNVRISLWKISTLMIPLSLNLSLSNYSGTNSGFRKGGGDQNYKNIIKCSALAWIRGKFSPLFTKFGGLRKVRGKVHRGRS